MSSSDPASVELSPLAHFGDHIVVEKYRIVAVTCLSEGYPNPDVVLQKRIPSRNEWMTLPHKETQTDVNGTTWTFSYNMTNETSCSLRCYADNGIGSPSTSSIIMVAVTDKGALNTSFIYEAIWVKTKTLEFMKQIF